MKQKHFFFFFLLGWVVLWSSCVYTEKIKDGRTAYELKQYSVAASMLTKEFEQSKDEQAKATIAFYLGETYKRLGDNAASMRWYFEAAKGGYGSRASLEFANALKREERYDEAIKGYQKAGRDEGNERAYIGFINACQIAQQWVKDAPNNEYQIKRLAINSPYFDYAPYPLGNGQIVFTSDRPQSPGDTYKWTGNKPSTIYQGNVITGQVEFFDPTFITGDNEGTFAMSRDGTKAAFTRCDPGNTFDIKCKIYYTFKDQQMWSEPILFDYTDESVNYSFPTFSEDGRLLVFAANYPNNQGGYDLYVSEFANGTYQEPIPLSNRINTSDNEIAPFLDQDTLYFASDRAGGMGGYDIYRTEMSKDGQWSPPINLKAPINSGADDLNFVIDRSADLKAEQLSIGYLTSSRKGGLGKDDIYFWERIQKEPSVDPSLTGGTDSLGLPTYTINLNLITQEKEFEIPTDPNSPVKFRKPLPNTRIEVLKNGVKIETISSNDFGTRQLTLDHGADYEFIGRKSDYLSGNYKLSTRNLPMTISGTDTTFQGRLLLEKIFYNKEIILENIYYDFDRWDIRKDAEPTLNELAALLAINEELFIQLASHTDCRGADEYNLNLSQRRAQSVVNYLIGKGIDGRRLVPRGFGESQPAINCVCESCTEDEHQINRRTTFAIIKEK
jgi:peptidoglycan-associated lipoprotein